MFTKIRVGNLPADTTRSAVDDMLTAVGDVRSVRIETVPDIGGEKRVAYVEMESASQAQDCVTKFNMTSYHGSVISVREDAVFVPRPRPAAALKAKNSKAKRTRTVNS